MTDETFTVNELVRVSGYKDFAKFKGHGKDGSITLWGPVNGNGESLNTARFRSAPAASVKKIRKEQTNGG